MCRRCRQEEAEMQQYARDALAALRSGELDSLRLLLPLLDSK